MSGQIMSKLQTHSDTFEWKNFSNRIGIGLYMLHVDLRPEHDGAAKHGFFG